jgi:hypothetical protein
VFGLTVNKSFLLHLTNEGFNWQMCLIQYNNYLLINGPANFSSCDLLKSREAQETKILGKKIKLVMYKTTSANCPLHLLRYVVALLITFRMYKCYEIMRIKILLYKTKQVFCQS